MESLKIVRGEFKDHSFDLEHIFKEHWDEIAKNKQLMQLKPDYDSYIRLDEIGKLLVLYAYVGEEVIGYSYNILNYHLHYSDLLVSFNDLLYIRPDYRKGTTGLRLMKETEIEAKKMGAHLMIWHAKENTSLSTILTKKNYKVQDITFSKEL